MRFVQGSIILLWVSKALQKEWNEWYDCAPVGYGGDTFISNVRHGDGRIIETITKPITATALGRGQSLCFTKSFPGTEVNEGRLAIYKVTLLEEENVYSYRNSKYRFVIPELEKTCTCHCPKAVLGKATCDSESDVCSDSDRREGLCQEYEEETQGSGTEDSCFSLTKDKGRVCCTVVGRKFSNKIYEAFYIWENSQSSSFNVSIAEYDFDTQELLRHEYHSLSAESSFNTMGNMTVIVTGTGSDAGLSVAGWYFGVYDGSDIMTNVEINDINTFDINKIGWMKWSVTGGLSWDPKEIIGAFNVHVENCLTSTFDLSLTARLQYPSEAKELADKNKESISEAVRYPKQEMIVLKKRNSKLNLKFAVKVGSVEENVGFYYVDSKFSNFTGSYKLDSSSNRYIKLQITEGRGTLYGKINSNQFTVHIPETALVYEESVQVTEPCMADQTLEVCLSVASRNRSAKIQCISVVCTAEEEDEFEDINDIDEQEATYKKGDKETIWNPVMWQKYLNPAEWFRGKMGTYEAIIMTVEIVAVVVTVGVVAKLMSCAKTIFKIFQKLFCCVGPSAKKYMGSTSSDSGGSSGSKDNVMKTAI